MDDLSWLESSRAAKVCPRPKRRASPGALIVGLVWVAVAALALLGMAMAFMTDHRPAEFRSHLQSVAEKEIRSRLYCPSTATFGPTAIEDLGSDRYRVTGSVDAQNRFSAMLRSEWTVELRMAKDGGYQIDSVSCNP